MNNDIISKEHTFHKKPYLKIHRSKYFDGSFRPPKRFRAIVFDLDETLGAFQDFYLLWIGLQEFQKHHFPFAFNELLDLYPEFVRTGIEDILRYVYHKKNQKLCKGVYLYTNNQNSVNWVQLLSRYFQYKIGSDSEFFDKIIYAFKINDKRVELGRTNRTKCHSDFINCTMLPHTTEICFIDNTMFSEMKHTYVYYIQPSSYNHTLSTGTIIQRFVNSKFISSWDKVQQKKLSDFLYFFFSHNQNSLPSINSPNKLEWDTLVAKKIMYHMKEFFLIQKMNGLTKKNKHKKKWITKFTRKNYKD